VDHRRRPRQRPALLDEKALAEVRQYERQSPVVGRRAAVDRWVDAAGAADPDAATVHDGDGTMTAADVIRRNAHEAVHHLLDISRQSATDRRTSRIE
jgi:hypothetical protein